jgi:hypothetical protein
VGFVFSRTIAALATGLGLVTTTGVLAAITGALAA